MRALCSSGIGIETLGGLSSFSCWGKVLSEDLSGLLVLSSPCTNRARSCVCFHGKRSRKTEKDEQNDRWKTLKSDTRGCAKVWKDLWMLLNLASLYIGNLPSNFYNPEGFNYAIKLKFNVLNKLAWEPQELKRSLTSLHSITYSLISGYSYISFCFVFSLMDSRLL